MIADWYEISAGGAAGAVGGVISLRAATEPFRAKSEPAIVRRPRTAKRSCCFVRFVRLVRLVRFVRFVRFVAFVCFVVCFVVSFVVSFVVFVAFVAFRLNVSLMDESGLTVEG